MIVLLSALMFLSVDKTVSVCVPLESANPRANPYHPSMISMKNAQDRKGFGLPTKTDGDIPCATHKRRTTFHV